MTKPTNDPERADLEKVAASFQAALGDVLDSTEFAIDLGGDSDALNEDGSLSVMTDDWTLLIEDWPGGPALLALDDEPDNPGSFPTVIQSVLGPPVIGAMATVNRHLNGQIAAALCSSGDPLSVSLANALE